MRLDDTYIDKPDDFSRKVGEKLREHHMSVDPDVWDSLVDRLPPQKKRVRSHWIWAAAGIAAIVSLILFLTLPFSDDPLLTEHSPSAGPMKQEADVPTLIPDKTVGKPAEESTTTPFPEELLAESQQDPKQVGNDRSVGDAQTEKRSAEIDAKKERIVENDAKQEKGVEYGSKKEHSVGEGKHKIVEGKVELVYTIAEDLHTDSRETAKPAEIVDLAEEVKTRPFSGPQSFIAALGSGDGMDLSWGDFLDADTPINSGTPSEDGYYDSNILGSGDDSHFLSPADHADVEHRLPVTFSLTTDFPIGKDVTLETGLSYTYLLSRLSNEGSYNYRGTLQQYYIGIPINLRYTVWHNDAWNIYLLGGGSIEKGIRSVFKQQVEHNGMVVSQSKDYSRIEGFQLSAQGGAGFSYRLHGNLHLFGEPRVIYYFKNNQPMSARTENPLIFGLNMGIRIQFK